MHTSAVCTAFTSREIRSDFECYRRPPPLFRIGSTVSKLDRLHFLIVSYSKKRGRKLKPIFSRRESDSFSRYQLQNIDFRLQMLVTLRQILLFLCCKTLSIISTDFTLLTLIKITLSLPSCLSEIISVFFFFQEY